VESTARLRVRNWWQLQGGYTELRVDIHPKPGSLDQTFGAAEAADSKHRLSLRSSFDLPGQVQLDAAFRYVSRITNPRVPVPGYSELDLRLAWLARPKLELSGRTEPAAPPPRGVRGCGLDAGYRTGRVRQGGMALLSSEPSGRPVLRRHLPQPIQQPYQTPCIPLAVRKQLRPQ
jgi:hypothetical protein